LPTEARTFHIIDTPALQALIIVSLSRAEFSHFEA